MTSYSKEQFDDNYPPGIEDHFWIKARNAIILDLVKKAGMAADTLMEVGCGRGIVVEYLRHEGMNCLGCELAPVPVPDHMKSHITVGTDATALDSQVRQAVTGLLMFDVIEHIDDATGCISRIAEAFPNAERLLITVPSGPELWSKWDEHFGHFRRYTRSSLRADLEQTGFTPTKFNSFFHSLYIPMRLMNVLGLERSTNQRAPSTPFLHALLARLFYLEYQMSPSWFIGTSLAVFARRNHTET